MNSVISGVVRQVMVMKKVTKSCGDVSSLYYKSLNNIVFNRGGRRTNTSMKKEMGSRQIYQRFLTESQRYKVLTHWPHFSYNCGNTLA